MKPTGSNGIVIFSAGNDFAIVDEEGWPSISQKNWFSVRGCTTKYAVANSQNTTIKLHRVIMSPSQGQVVHHLNGDGLDNRRCNLQLCTYQRHNAIGKQGTYGKSKYRGVSLNTPNRRKPWQARIGFNYGRRLIGYYETEKEAALAYNQVARELYGDLAFQNDIEIGG